MVRGSTAFLLQEQHTTLYGNSGPRRALFFTERLKSKRAGWLILVNFILCTGVGAVAYGVASHDGEGALQWLGGFGTFLAVLQGLIFWLFS
jgi:hypothetical protein